MSRAISVQQSLGWMQMARDTANEIIGNHAADPISKIRAEHIVRCINHAFDRLHEALDIKPSDAAIDEVRAEVTKERAA